MAVITRVYTVSRAAKMLGVPEDALHEWAITMEWEDGYLWAYGDDDDGTLAFTPFGIENLREMILDMGTYPPTRSSSA